jgi:hypothetical protein
MNQGEITYNATFGKAVFKNIPKNKKETIEKSEKIISTLNKDEWWICKNY